MSKLQYLSSTLGSPKWRLENLYNIVDKDGKILRYSPTTIQKRVLNHDHQNLRTIYLKSRQVGITTTLLLKRLDTVLTTPTYSAGIQSYGKDETKKLVDKVMVAINGLPANGLKEIFGLEIDTKNSTSGIKFSNGSSLSIGNFRGSTQQSLHISELAKLSMKYPDKAKELKTGAFQAVGNNNRISVESTAEGRFGMYPDMWNLAVGNKHSTTLDFAPLFIPWTEDSDCRYNSSIVPTTEELYEYFNTVSEYVALFTPYGIYDKVDITLVTDKKTIVLDESQVAWLTIKLRELGEDFNREYPLTPELAFAQSVHGTYFRKQYNTIVSERRILKVWYNTNYKVYVSWDLGVADETVLLFWQVVDGRILLIDEYSSSDDGIEHYIEILNKYKILHNIEYSYLIVPHDIAVRDFSSSQTRANILRDAGFRLEVVQRIAFNDSITNARTLLISNLIINSSCKYTIVAIQNYRKKKDEKLNIYLDTDVHDINSNYMASFRYGATYLGRYITTKTAIHIPNYQAQKKVRGFTV